MIIAICIKDGFDKWNRQAGTKRGECIDTGGDVDAFEQWCYDSFSNWRGRWSNIHMNLYNNLILIKGEDKTNEIKSCHHENSKYHVVFSNSSKVFRYDYMNVVWLRDPVALSTKDYRISKEGKLFYDVETILRFNDYIRVFFKDSEARSYPITILTVEKNSLSNPKSESCLEYFKKLADIISLVTEDGTNILAKQYEKIAFVAEKTALSAFFSGKLTTENIKERQIYFPFGCNLSQMSAVEKALSNNISVVEGPPGTGKTQTILNIIANIIISEKNVAIVSGNNSATANIAEKLEKYGFGFIVASLGNGENKKDFIANQSSKYPSVDGYNSTVEEMKQKQEDILSLEKELTVMLASQNKVAELKKELNSIEIEGRYFQDFLSETHSVNGILKANRLSSAKALSLLIDMEQRKNKDKGFSFLFKLKHLLISGIANFSFYKNSITDIITMIKVHYYKVKTSELSDEINKTEKSLEMFDFKEKMDLLSTLSLAIFKNSLHKKYANKGSRRIFKEEDLWENSSEFNKEYPVVLSTAYSIKSSLDKTYLFDYVIVDEASQVDLITGVLALSCAKNIVIVGDTKQLPNVVSEEDKRQISGIFNEFSLADGYEYSKNSLLLSVCDVLPSVSRTLLREHYRCHPKIIEFCNAKFYRNELIIMTQDNGEEDVIKAYKTVLGNHARGHINQRQIDEIKQAVLPPLTECFSRDEIGIIAPYRKQTEQIKNDAITADLDISTVHKFQGREKDAIIITTVDNEITEFTDNPNMLNVAVSRARKALRIVISDNEKNENTNIGDLVRYIKYNNFEVVPGEVYSVFDLLYKGLEEKRKEFLKKHTKISEFDSENLMFSLILEIFEQDKFNSLDVSCHQPLNTLIRDLTKLDAEQIKYVTNPWTHVDFVVFHKLDKMPILVIEVDGYAYHKECTLQHQRDLIKNVVLEKYSIPFLRLSTTGSMEKEQIILKLNTILSV